MANTIDNPIVFIVLGNDGKRHVQATIASVASADVGNRLKQGSDGKLMADGAEYLYVNDATGTVTHSFVVTTNPSTGAKTVSVKADPKISVTASNEISLNSDGLYARGQKVTSITSSGNTLTLNYSDSAGTSQQLTASLVTSVAMNLDPVAKTLTTTVNGVTSTPLDISGLTTDINVGTVEWNASTYVFKLTETDGTIHNLDLSSLVASSVQHSITGSGTVQSPLQLVGDVANPGNWKVYGTNAAGVRGWLATLPAAASGNTVANVQSVPLTYLGAHGRVLDVSDPDVLVPLLVRQGTTIKRITYDAQSGAATAANETVASDTTFQVIGYAN